MPWFRPFAYNGLSSLLIIKGGIIRAEQNLRARTVEGRQREVALRS